MSFWEEGRKERKGDSEGASEGILQPRGAIKWLILHTTDVQAAGDALKRAIPSNAGEMKFLVNFPLFWKMCVDMMKAGSGYAFDSEVSLSLS